MVKRDRCDILFRADALPYLIEDDGGIATVGTDYAPGMLVFASDAAASNYMVALAKRDLQCRGLRGTRTGCFEEKQKANYLLHQRIQRCECESEKPCGKIGIH